MLKFCLPVLSVLYLFLYPQAVVSQVDSNKKKALPTGFSWGGTPILAYDADLGLKYGALINLFDYGQPTVFPSYENYTNLRLFHTTKGTSNLSAYFESNTAIKPGKLIAELSYINDQLLDFYGFNGLQTLYNQSITDDEDHEFINVYYYKHQRRLIRARVDAQLPVVWSKSKLFAGIAYKQYRIDEVDFEKFGSESDDPQVSLYQQFTDWQLINPDEAMGGSLAQFTLGYLYDSRDNTINCRTGFWVETYLVHTQLLHIKQSFTKHIASLRYYHYWPFSDAVLAIRLSTQHRLQGRIPFYALNTFYDTRLEQDGLGGAFTLRGINRNRIVSDGFALLNTELRKSIFNFNLTRLRWQIDLSLFGDLSYLTQYHEYDQSRIPLSDKDRLISNAPNRFNFSFGPGLYLIYNTNNVISVNLGYSPDNQLGKYGLYVGSGFLF